MLGCVGWAGRAPSPDVLGRCAAVDEKAAALFSQRDQALLSATAALLVCLTLSATLDNLASSSCIHWPSDSCLPDCHRSASYTSAYYCTITANDKGWSLQEYSAALQQVLPEDYAASSQHAKWSTAFAASLAAHAQSLPAGERSIDDVQVRLQASHTSFRVHLLGQGCLDALHALFSRKGLYSSWRGKAIG